IMEPTTSAVSVVSGNPGPPAAAGAATDSGISRADALPAAMGPSSVRQGVLVDLAVLHDDEKALVGIGDELDVVERISIDEQKISQRARLDYAELARIGIALSGESQQLG